MIKQMSNPPIDHITPLVFDGSNPQPVINPKDDCMRPQSVTVLSKNCSAYRLSYATLKMVKAIQLSTIGARKRKYFGTKKSLKFIPSSIFLI